MRLTPFEEYMLVDDRCGYPMVFFYRLRLEGQLHRERFTHAVREQARREPLFSATISADTSSRVEKYCFVKTNQEVAITWDIPQTIPHLDLETEVGLRLFATETHTPSGVVTELLFQVHHACCDGLGFACFLERCFQNYLGQTDTQPDIQPENTNKTCGSVYRIIRNAVLAPLRVMQMLRLGFVYWRHASPLTTASPNFSATAPPQQFPSSVSVTLSPEKTQSLRRAARTRKVTLTDCLITAVYLAIAAQKNIHDSRPTRLSIPVSLRNLATNKLAINAVSMVFIDRCVKHNTSHACLLRSVVSGMRWAKRLGDAEAFLWGLRFLKAFPRLLPHVVRNRNRCWATMVVSNLGRLFGDKEVRLTAGTFDATLKSIDVLPPVRGWTAAALSIVTYAGKMTLALHYDVSRLTEQEATALLTSIAKNIS